MRLLKTLLGTVFYFLLVLLGFMFNGGHLESLLHPGEMFMVLFAVPAVLAGAYGFSGATKLLRASLSSRRQATLAIPSAKLERFLSHWIVAVYATAFLAFFLGLIVTMGFVAGPSVKVGEKVASAMAAFFWAILVAEGFLRPLKRRIGEEA